MNFAEQLAAVVSLLRAENLQFSLAGGLIASLYRTDERLTKDLDILILAHGSHEQAAKEVLKKLNLEPALITKAELEGGPLHAIKRKSTPVWMVCGTSTDPSVTRVDFLLPLFPWFHRAIERSQRNLVDFGFGPVPALTREDLIISKIFAVANRSNRFKDLDDLQSIFHGKTALDINYLLDRMTELNLEIPDSIKPEAPELLRKIKRSR